jgi:hypothetical protein
MNSIKKEKKSYLKHLKHMNELYEIKQFYTERDTLNQLIVT